MRTWSRQGYWLHRNRLREQHTLEKLLPSMNNGSILSVISTRFWEANVVERQLFGHSTIHSYRHDYLLDIRSIFLDLGDISSSPYWDMIQQL
jgi:hypothetical protein